jgi:hypothetical protein
MSVRARRASERTPALPRFQMFGLSRGSKQVARKDCEMKESEANGAQIKRRNDKGESR